MPNLPLETCARRIRKLVRLRYNHLRVTPRKPSKPQVTGARTGIPSPCTRRWTPPRLPARFISSSARCCQTAGLLKVLKRMTKLKKAPRSTGGLTTFVCGKVDGKLTECQANASTVAGNLSSTVPLRRVINRRSPKASTLAAVEFRPFVKTKFSTGDSGPY